MIRWTWITWSDIFKGKTPILEYREYMRIHLHSWLIFYCHVSFREVKPQNVVLPFGVDKQTSLCNPESFASFGTDISCTMPSVSPQFWTSPTVDGTKCSKLSWYLRIDQFNNENLAPLYTKGNWGFFFLDFWKPSITAPSKRNSAGLVESWKWKNGCTSNCSYLSQGIQLASENGVMEPEYQAFWRWLYTPIIIWQGDWITRVSNTAMCHFHDDWRKCKKMGHVVCLFLSHSRFGEDIITFIHILQLVKQRKNKHVLKPGRCAGPASKLNCLPLAPF